MLSAAVAEIATVDDTVALLAGELIETVGFTVSVDPADVFTLTLSNCAVTQTPCCALCTATPMYALAAMATVVVPTGVQLMPSGETEALNTFPLRASRSQFGCG